MSLSFDLTRIDYIIRHAAEAEIMPRFRRLAAGDVEMKGVNDPVTVADKAAEKRLTALLTKSLPGSLVVGEESFAADQAILSRLDGGQPVWIIDPIDGTRNFVAGNPEFAVMVALVHNRETVAGWIHNPVSGDTMMAEQGGGVWLRGERVRLALDDPGLPLIGLVGARLKKFLTDPAIMLQGDDMPRIEIGSCCGFDYPRFFTGQPVFAHATSSRVGFSVYRHTNAWDHTAGLMLHREAGGYSADWAGNPYDMAQPRSGLLLAPNEDVWHRLHDAFQPFIAHMSRQVP